MQSIAMPLHDPGCLIIHRLVETIPLLESMFDRICLGVTELTQAACSSGIETFLARDTIRVIHVSSDLPVGDQILALYRFAAQVCPEKCNLHLCYPDRVVFAVQTDHRQAFKTDIASISDSGTPTLFQRSPAAWETHPRNYQEMEGFLNFVGKSLFDCNLEFAWCHLALPVARLRGILALIRSTGFAALAEIVLLLRDEINVREVDWLAWEDPYLLGVDFAWLKAQREASPAEARKRLGYVIPMLQLLYETDRG